MRRIREMDKMREERSKRNISRRSNMKRKKKLTSAEEEANKVSGRRSKYGQRKKKQISSAEEEANKVSGRRSK